MNVTTGPAWPDDAVATDPAAPSQEPDAPPPLKPGWVTSEFWLTLAASVMSLLVGLHVVGPDFAKAHEDVVNALCFLAATLAPAIYAVARSIAKSGHQKAVATVIASRGTPLTASFGTLLRSDEGLSPLGVVLFIVAVLIVLSLGFAVNNWLLLLILLALLLLLF